MISILLLLTTLKLIKSKVLWAFIFLITRKCSKKIVLCPLLLNNIWKKSKLSLKTLPQFFPWKPFFPCRNYRQECLEPGQDVVMAMFLQKYILQYCYSTLRNRFNQMCWFCVWYNVLESSNVFGQTDRELSTLFKMQPEGKQLDSDPFPFDCCPCSDTLNHILE